MNKTFAKHHQNFTILDCMDEYVLSTEISRQSFFFFFNCPSISKLQGLFVSPNSTCTVCLPLLKLLFRISLSSTSQTQNSVNTFLLLLKTYYFKAKNDFSGVMIVQNPVQQYDVIRCLNVLRDMV